MDVLTRIKRLIVRRRYRFTAKAEIELEADGLAEADLLESILSARRIKMAIVSRNPEAIDQREMLYVIESPNYQGTLVYSKGKIAREAGEDIYYVFISSKRSRIGE